MRILHFAPYLVKGGVAEVWINLTKAFAKLNCEVYLIGPHITHLKNYVSFYHISKSPPTYISDPLYTLAYIHLNKELVEKILRKENIDVLLTHGPLAIIYLEKSIASKVKCYSVIHGTYANEVKWMKFHPISGLEKLKYMLGIKINHSHDMKLYNLLSRRDVRFIAVSSKTREELIDAGVLKSSIHSILNGVDKQFFKPMNKSEARNYLEERFNIRADELVIAHVGLSPRKGTHNLIRALALLRNKNIKFTALLIGKAGPKTYKYHLERMIKTFNLEEHIKLLGSISSIDLLHVYNASDVTVVPSYSEGAPLVIPESLACRTPVIATNVGGNAEYLDKAHLNELVVRIKEYDTSKVIYQKLINVVERHQSYRRLIEPSKVHSWTDTAINYIKAIRFGLWFS